MSEELSASSLDSDGITVSSQFDKRFGIRVLKKKIKSRVMKKNIQPDYIKQINKIIQGGN